MESLKEYNKKRDFAKTAEPRGKTAKKPEKRLKFVVQHHIASRDHYDFRLEWNGVLKSWAVPKGPSYDTHDKRLAVQVEDHPFDYRNFEGTIPKGEYGGGVVMLWDEGEWLPSVDVDAGLAGGSLKFTLQGERLKGAWALVRMKPRPGEKNDNWLLIKERDEYVDEYDIREFDTSIQTGRTMEEIESGAKAKPARKKTSARAAKSPEPEAPAPRRRPAQAAATPSASSASTASTARSATIARSASSARPAPAGTPERPAPTDRQAKDVKITNPEKVLFTESGITKGEVAEYYLQIAGRMMPYLENRILSVVRCPGGIESSCFFKKHPNDTRGVVSVQVPVKNGESDEYFYVPDAYGLMFEVQMNTLEFHTWGSRADDLEKPDFMVFDLDPDEGMDLDRIRQGVSDLKGLLDDLSLVSYLKTSGGKGYHVVIPFRPVAGWDSFRDFAKNIAVAMEAKWPDRYTSNVRKVRRKGRIFVDWIRNGRGATSVAPYSVRAREGAPVSMPITWKELETVTPGGVTMQEAVKRLRRKDPWAGFFDNDQRLK